MNPKYNSIKRRWEGNTQFGRTHLARIINYHKQLSQNSVQPKKETSYQMFWNPCTSNAITNRYLYKLQSTLRERGPEVQAMSQERERERRWRRLQHMCVRIAFWFFNARAVETAKQIIFKKVCWSGDLWLEIPFPWIPLSLNLGYFYCLVWPLFNNFSDNFALPLLHHFNFLPMWNY